MGLRLVSDVHGKVREYISLAKSAEYSLQLGDLSLDYTCLEELDGNQHKVLPGNHDDYPTILRGDYKNHVLGDFGYTTFAGHTFFFVRGGYSIDFRQRTEGIDWFREEELNYEQSEACIRLYNEVKPDFVVSHECPSLVSNLVSTISTAHLERVYGCKLPSYTAKLLSVLFVGHRPKSWIFGHYHCSKTVEFEGCTFTCLNELEYLDLP